MRNVSAVLVVAMVMSVSLAQQRTTIVHMNNPQTKVEQLPYTAEYKITKVQTLANGATISHESTETKARDAQGRRVTAKTDILERNGDGATRTTVTVNDPVARTNSSWLVPGHTVTVNQMPAPGARANCVTTIAPKTPETPTRIPKVVQQVPFEDLGTEEIAGVEAKGRRTTTVIPAGQIGNDEPLTRTNDFWEAINPGLWGLMVRTITEDPQQGKTTMEMTRFTQGDPDPALFQPPSDYEVVTKEANTGCSSSSSGPITAQP